MHTEHGLCIAHIKLIQSDLFKPSGEASYFF